MVSWPASQPAAQVSSLLLLLYSLCSGGSSSKSSDALARRDQPVDAAAVVVLPAGPLSAGRSVKAPSVCGGANNRLVSISIDHYSLDGFGSAYLLLPLLPASRLPAGLAAC